MPVLPPLKMLEIIAEKRALAADQLFFLFLFCASVTVGRA
jgi:hypothetical protein